MLKVPALSETTGSPAPQGLRLVNTSPLPRSARRQEEEWNELPPHRRTDDASGSSESRIDAQQTSAIFRRKGEYWQILYKGECIRIRSMKGLFYLRHLLQHPGERVHVCGLAALGDHYASATRAVGSSADRGLDVPPLAPLVANDVGAVIDHRATWEYRARLDELRTELDEASQWADFGRVASIQREIDFIQKEIGSAYGLGGQLRKLDDQIERTRKAVTNRIRDSIVRIAKQNSVLGRHFRNAIRTGLLCQYAPENKVFWEF